MFPRRIVNRFYLSSILAAILAAGFLFGLIFSSPKAINATEGGPVSGLLKVNGNDTSLTIPLNVANGTGVTLSWTGLSGTCSLTDSEGFTYSIPAGAIPNGSRSYTVSGTVGATKIVELTCTGTPLLEDAVIIKIISASTPTPAPSPTITADLYIRYQNNNFSQNSKFSPVSITIPSGSPAAMQIYWNCSSGTTNTTLNGTVKTATSGNESFTINPNESKSWTLVCIGSSSSNRDTDSLQVNTNTVSPTPQPTPTSTPTGSLTINGQKEVALDLSNLPDTPLKLKWTKNQFSCNIDFRSIATGVNSTFAYLQATDTEGESEIDQDFILTNEEVEFSLVCDPDTAPKVVDKAIIRFKKITVTFKVNEIVSDRDSQGLSYRPLGGVQICSEKWDGDKPTCYSPLTNNQGITTFEIQQGRFLFSANKIGYYSNGPWETVDSNKTIEIDLINRDEVTSRVTGYVKDKNGKAVAGITVGIVKASRVSLNGLYTQDTFFQAAITNQDGLFVLDLGTTNPLDLTQSYQITILTDVGSAWRVKALSATFKFDRLYGQYKKINIVYTPETNNNIRLYFRLLSFETMQELSDRAKRNINIIIKTRDGFILWNGTGEKFIEFIRQRGERDLAQESLIIEIQSNEYSGIRRQIFIGADANRSYEMVLRPKNQDYCRRRPQSNNSDFWFCGYESEENAFFANPVYNNLVQAIDRQVKSLASSQKMPTVRIVQQVSYDGSLSIDDIYKGCDAAVSLNISTGLLQAEQNNVSIIQHITAHEFGHFKDYYNAGRCNFVSNQSSYIFSMEKIDTHIEGPIFYKLINEQYYDQASVAGGIGHANANRKEAYASTFHIKRLHSGDTFYNNTWGSMSGGFAGIVSRYIGLVMQNGEVK